VDQVLTSYGIPHDHSMVTTEPIDVIDGLVRFCRLKAIIPSELCFCCSDKTLSFA
jgi:hypothetical protein